MVKYIEKILNLIRFLLNSFQISSKRHLMKKILNDKSMPFYKIGDMMFLQKIPASEWIPFICGKFEEIGKHIRAEQAERICIYTENLSSYVQHLSWIVGIFPVQK